MIVYDLDYITNQNVIEQFDFCLGEEEFKDYLRTRWGCVVCHTYQWQESILPHTVIFDGKDVFCSKKCMYQFYFTLDFYNV